MSEDAVLASKGPLVACHGVDVIHVAIGGCEPFQVVDLCDALLTDK